MVAHVRAARPLGALPAVSALYAANAGISGFSLAALARTHPGLVAAGLEQALTHLASGLPLEVNRLIGLAQAGQAHDALASGRGDPKYVIENQR